MPKVSVVVPVYGVEKYIERCARSLFNQTLEDIEYIFVNDCTPDGSIDVLNRVMDEYPDRRNNCKIISHSRNLGLAASRKTGIDNALSDYVAFCDSDDWISESMFELLYNKAVEEDSDMVICGYHVSDGNSLIASYSVKPTKNPFKDLLTDNIPNFTCTKLIRRTLFGNEFNFPRANMYEDTCLICQIAFYCKEISIVPQPLYYYFRNNDGLCLSKLSEERFLGAKDNIDIAVAFLKARGLEKSYREEIESIECRIPRLSTQFPGKVFRKYNKNICWKLLSNRYVPFKEKLGYATKLLGIHGISGMFKMNFKLKV